MVIARCFWALIKFITTYLLAFVIAHSSACDMLVVSYIRLRFILSKILGCDFPFSSSMILSTRVLLLSWFPATRTFSMDPVEGFGELVGSLDSS